MEKWKYMRLESNGKVVHVHVPLGFSVSAFQSLLGSESKGLEWGKNSSKNENAWEGLRMEENV